MNKLTISIVLVIFVALYLIYHLYPFQSRSKSQSIQEAANIAPHLPQKWRQHYSKKGQFGEEERTKDECFTFSELIAKFNIETEIQNLQKLCEVGILTKEDGFTLEGVCQNNHSKFSIKQSLNYVENQSIQWESQIFSKDQKQLQTEREIYSVIGKCDE